ncbi:MFS transporter [Gracilibacillus caseinilyticus]|uniref:MFS transporter n=1 Tax=Gracilibacillus caseinilyticus TaxID=2932256 RepID=A0ABY4EY44_9BACI|nr:MFS transporter [Gracilibacillus caseinilyticus]UOQ48768.1 MFS transporter [Gracilibacillus caseinilyticus]
MSQQLQRLEPTRNKMAIPPYLVISFLTIFAIGAQYFSNLSYVLNQGVIQNGLHISSDDLLLPSILSNLAFALGVPLGPVLTRQLGLRRNYLLFTLIFLCGSVIDVVSTGIVTLSIGRVVQGFGSGILFLTILPVSLRSFPNKIRNLFLLMIITGLFGASALGALCGSLSLYTDSWRWLFLFNVIASLLCFIIGYFGLPRQEETVQEQTRIDKKAVVLLCATILSFAVPLCRLTNEGFSSLYVWPFLGIGLLLLGLFIYVDQKAEAPLVPFRTLKAAKPVSGTIMAVVSHASLIIAIAGINGFLQHNMDLSYLHFVYFYAWFFVGIIGSAILKTLLYDKLGAGVLGMLGSLVVLYVSFQWMVIETDISLPFLYFQIACLGCGVSMVLVSGALGTALAGDIHQASMRSATLHSIRNFIGATLSPLVGWLLLRQNTIHYQEIKQHVNVEEASSQLEGTVKKSAILGAYHDLFTILFILGFIMFVASVVKMTTGKGRALVQK